MYVISHHEISILTCEVVFGRGSSLTYACAYLHMYVCTYVCTHTYMSIHLYIFVFLAAHNDKKNANVIFLFESKATNKFYTINQF